jgi:GR25 family glycosyltransferase involved in LPS biosynthesis
LAAAELGCLLGHRKIWRLILSEPGNSNQHYLIVESDSIMADANFFTSNFNRLTKDTDIFFWGAFDGRMKLFSSTVSLVSEKYRVGTPLINSLYCTYGYSLNKKMASWMLNQTARITYPCDHFKRYFQLNEVRIGGVLPEVIRSNNSGGSQTRPGFGNKLYWYFFDKLVDLKNELITRYN